MRMRLPRPATLLELREAIAGGSLSSRFASARRPGCLYPTRPGSSSTRFHEPSWAAAQTRLSVVCIRTSRAFRQNREFGELRLVSVLAVRRPCDASTRRRP